MRLLKRSANAVAATPDELARMGAVGRAHVLEQFDALKEAQKLKQLFKHSIEAQSGSRGFDIQERLSRAVER